MFFEIISYPKHVFCRCVQFTLHRLEKACIRFCKRYPDECLVILSMFSLFSLFLRSFCYLTSCACVFVLQNAIQSSSIQSGCSGSVAGFRTGLPGPDGPKCQIAHQNMPTRFTQCQTNWKRLMAVRFELSGWWWQRYNAALEPQAWNYCK